MKCEGELTTPSQRWEKIRINLNFNLWEKMTMKKVRKLIQLIQLYLSKPGQTVRDQLDDLTVS